MSSVQLDDFSKLIPSCLDDIITINRDKATLRMATDVEIACLPPLIDMVDGRPVKEHEICDWLLICLDIPGVRTNPFFLVGYRQDGVFATSSVLSMDYKNGQGLAFTRNSFYKLGQKSKSPPDTPLLLHICACMGAWGMGGMFGVLPIFY